MKGLTGLAMKTNRKTDEASSRSSKNDNGKPSQECRFTARTRHGSLLPPDDPNDWKRDEGYKPKTQRSKK